VKKMAFTNMKKQLVTAFMVFLAVSTISSACLADTFTNRKTQEIPVRHPRNSPNA